MKQLDPVPLPEIAAKDDPNSPTWPENGPQLGAEPDISQGDDFPACLA